MRAPKPRELWRLRDRQARAVGADHLDAGAADRKAARVHHLTEQGAAAQQRESNRLGRLIRNRDHGATDEVPRAAREGGGAVRDRPERDLTVTAAPASQWKRAQAFFGQHDVRVGHQMRIGARAVGDERGHEATRLERQRHFLILSALQQEADQDAGYRGGEASAQVVATR
jgi:hypothetical protein